MRLDKFLVEMNKGSRNEIKAAAKKGRIQVNGSIAAKTDRQIDPETDKITMDGVAVTYCRREYYMLNKPRGVISATADKHHQTVLDLLSARRRKDLFPVGRLDIDTEGLLLITNDGDLAHRLLSPKKHVDKQYYAVVSGTLPADAAAIMAAGMTLSDGTAVKPARLEILSAEPDESRVYLTIREGKFHQVKRMFEALGGQVEYLKRLSMGSLVLDERLKPGEYRELTETEITVLSERKYPG